ncbi:hypothetical protein [Nocardia sp. NPDC057030]|uniref:hypothetical protein n=1 Tax=unclassified Nocardia TaxID=2637762 RepID=UPI00363EDAFD
MTAKTTLTVVISRRDHELLTSVAAIKNLRVAEQARQILSEGIRRLLDPAEIDKLLDTQRIKWLAACEAVRAESGTADDD